MKKTSAEIATTRKTLAQVILCLGCCCGRTDKGHPEVPVEWMKHQWRQRALAKKVQLTISGCLGPCDASNVVLVMIGDQPVWLGGLDENKHYAALVDWASACDRAGSAIPLPASLAPFRMDRFHGSDAETLPFEPRPLCPDAKVA